MMLCVCPLKDGTDNLLARGVWRQPDYPHSSTTVYFKRLLNTGDTFDTIITKGMQCHVSCRVSISYSVLGAGNRPYFNSICMVIW
jgi:hypothetical protein